jgi:hypothetical protein
MSPADLLLALLLHEAPVIATKPTLNASWSSEITSAVILDSRIASSALLVSPDVDAALLDAARWYEARLASHPKDGDCHAKADRSAPQGFRIVCSAFGPLQVQTTALHALFGSPESAQAGLGTGHLTAADLRDPETGVRAGYAALARWKNQCGGTPARWLTAWGWGKCPPPRTVDREAVRRCELATMILAARDAVPEGWKCGHEGRKISGEHDARLLHWGWQQIKDQRAAKVEAEEDAK